MVKRFLINLRRSLLYRELTSNYYLIVIGIVLGLFTILRFNYGLLIITIIYFIYLFISSYLLGLTLSVLLLIISSNYFIRTINYNKYQEGFINIEATIIKIKNTTNKYQLTIESNKNQYLFYLDKITNEVVGSQIHITGKLIKGEKIIYHIPLIIKII